MPVVSRLISTVRSLVGAERLDKNLDEELRSYVAMRVDELAASGVPPDEARRRARLELGVEQVKEQVRGRRRGAGIDSFVRDGRIGLRLIGRSPGFSTVAILTLAIGIGATSAAFSIVHAALLRDLPFEQPDRLVFGEKTIHGVPSRWVSRIDYYDFRDSSRSFEHLAAMGSSTASLVVTGRGDPWPAAAMFVTANLFAALRVVPVAGRGFLAEEETRGGAQVVVISHAVWQTRYGASPTAIGSGLTLNGVAHTIVGVMPAGFRFVDDADLWLLVDHTGPWDMTRDSHSHILVGRLKPDVSIEQAQADVSGIASGLAERFPDTNAQKGLILSPLHDGMVRDVRPSLLLLMGVTALVLLVACANVAGLLLSRGQQRVPEMAMRSALGATRGRLVRQLVIESSLLTGAGGLLGLLLAHGLLRLARPLFQAGPAGLEPPDLDGVVLLFTGAVSMLTGLLIGVVPAFRGTTKAPASHLGRGRQGTDAVRGGRLRGALVVAQVAFSIGLLVVSGLFLRSLVRVNSVELGFDPDRLLAARLSISQVDYPTPAAQREFFASVLEQVSALPGVLSASAASKLPIQGRATDWGVWRADRPRPERGRARSYLARWVYPRYLETMRIPLRRGREISPRDVAGAPQVVVLSESAVRDLFGNEDPIGSPVVIWGRSGTYEVVGVAADAVLESALNGPRSAFYIPAAQMGATGLRLVVRTSGDPSAVTAAVRDVVRRVGRDALMSDDRPMRAVVDEALDSFRIVIVSLSVFAVVALGLAAVGLYGALAYHVSQQQHELGVRMAVGASRGRVLALVARRGGVLTGVGMALGMAGAAAGTRLVRTLLFDTALLDPASYVGAAVLFVLVAAVACGVPAWRATRIDPVTVLRV